MNIFRLIFRLIILLIIVGAVWVIVVWYVGVEEKEAQPVERVEQRTFIQEIQGLGKVELVKYTLQDVTEITKEAKGWYRYLPNSTTKMLLVASGEAVGCIDLLKMEEGDIRDDGDTLYITMPAPEFCYYKINLEDTKLYSLNSGTIVSEKNAVQEAYRRAETQMREAAIQKGIYTETEAYAQKLLKPFLSRIANKPVVLTFREPEITLDPAF